MLRSATQPEAGDCVSEIARRIDLESLVADLPAEPRETLVLLMTSQGDIAEALAARGVAARGGGARRGATATTRSGCCA